MSICHSRLESCQTFSKVDVMMATNTCVHRARPQYHARVHSVCVGG